MKRMRQQKLNNIANFCGYCVANVALGFLLLTLGFAFAVAFCNICGLPTSWANNII